MSLQGEACCTLMYSQAKAGGQSALHQGLLLYSITWLLMHIIPKPL